jgi:4-amino-4-deoxy-L-arabinose transferase-like glycosyltransferase
VTTGDGDTPLARLRALLLDPRAHAAILTACAALVLLARAGAGPLANYDDAYYAEKAKQMLRTGDWLTPRFAGVERLDNPPLFLWLMAGSFAVLGVRAFAAVLWSALAGVACVALTHRLARRLGFEPFEAWAAALVLLSTGYFLKYANHAMFDVFLTALFLLTLLAYRRAWEGERAAWVAAGVFTGLGVLTKSALGLLPMIVITAHALWCGRVRRSIATGAWLTPLVAIGVLLPWYGYQLVTHRDAFLREHVAWLLVQRGLGSGVEAGSPSSPFAYVRELALTYWPWLPAAAYGLWLVGRESFAPVTVYTSAGALPREWKPRDGSRLLLMWPVVVLVLLSAAHEQKLWYAMSVFPALALCAARALGTWLTGERLRARVVLGGFTLAAAAGAVLALTPIGLPAPRRPDIQLLAAAARSMVPEQDAIQFAGGSYFSVAHQFVFYSDRLLLQERGGSAGVRAALDQGQWALVARDRYAGVTGGDGRRYPAVVTAGGWMLVHVAPAPSVVLGRTGPGSSNAAAISPE